MRKRTCISVEFIVLYVVYCRLPNNLDFSFLKRRILGFCLIKHFRVERSKKDVDNSSFISKGSSRVLARCVMDVLCATGQVLRGYIGQG